MVSQIIECLTAYKFKMEYQNKGFDVGRPAQYKEMRKEMPKVLETCEEKH